jgi:ABC transporter substrate binding protein
MPSRVRVAREPDIILTNSTPATAALQRETRTIPIVFTDVAEPVASGIVPRLDRPGGNITGFGILEPSLGGKWLELLSEIAPGLKRAAIMFNPDTATGSLYVPSLETAARSLKVVPIIAPVHSDAEIETAIIAVGREPGAAVARRRDRPRRRGHRHQPAARPQRRRRKPVAPAPRRDRRDLDRPGGTMTTIKPSGAPPRYADPLRREIRHDLREHGRRPAWRAAIAAEKVKLADAAMAELNAIGDVSSMSRQEYERTKARALRLTRTALNPRP